MQECEALNRAREMIHQSKEMVFFGGAGVSTASGIPDFRSPNGLYHTMKDAKYAPEYYFSHEFSVEKPDEFADFVRTCLKSYEVEPSAAHVTLARWEARGLLSAVITQNIDSLHQKAGSARVYEVHGNMADIYCPACGYTMPTEEYLAHTGRVVCPVCGKLMRPRVVLYGEALDATVFGRAMQAIAHADTLIVGGTSLVVYPAAGLVDLYHGHQLILINREPTPADDRADVVLHGDIAEILPALDREG